MFKGVKTLSILALGLILSSCLLVAAGQKASLKEHKETATKVKRTETPLLTQVVSCTVKHVYGCNWKKPYCADEGFAIPGGSEIVYELDLLNRVGRLRGDKSVAVQINTLSSTPGFDVINVQGINEEWIPWTLSFKTSTGRGFLTQASPDFTVIYLVNCTFGPLP
jgi:hypothetical protein